jgi:hypothetical protein
MPWSSAKNDQINAPAAECVAVSISGWNMNTIEL